MDNKEFVIKSSEIRLKFRYPEGERRLAVNIQEFEKWKITARQKLLELLCIDENLTQYGKITELRTLKKPGYIIKALIMDVADTLQLPAYLLVPDNPAEKLPPVLAVQGHGSVLGVIGFNEDYHHKFAEELCLSGRIVLAPEMRGFGALKNLSAQLPLGRLDYGNWGNPLAFTMVTDAFQKGRTLIGDSVSDLRAWSEYLLYITGAANYDAAGISYGGDMVLCLTAIDSKVRRAFISGSFGSFIPIFDRCYNLPAHCIPGILPWMDRVDIAAMCAPCPVCYHYGELDTPSMDNSSASYNETVLPAFNELLKVYASFGATDSLSMHVTKGAYHEMDIPVLKDFLNKE